MTRARALSSAGATATAAAPPHASCFALLATLPPRRLAAALLATNLLHALLRHAPSPSPSRDSAPSLPPPPRLLPLFLPDTAVLRLRLYQMGRLLLRRQPLLHSALATLGVPPSSYASPWLLTLCGSFTALDCAGVLALWDAAVGGWGGGGAWWWAGALGACLAVMEGLAPLLVGEGGALEDALPPLRAPRLYYAQARAAAVAGAAAAGGGGGGQRGGGAGAGAGEGVGAVWLQPYSLATRGGGSGGGGGGAPLLTPVQCIVRYALTCEACRVSLAELAELEENFEAFKHLEDQH